MYTFYLYDPNGKDQLHEILKDQNQNFITTNSEIKSLINASTQVPPNVKENEAIFFNEKKEDWVILPDYRKKTIYYYDGKKWISYQVKEVGDPKKELKRQNIAFTKLSFTKPERDYHTIYTWDTHKSNYGPHYQQEFDKIYYDSDIKNLEQIHQIQKEDKLMVETKSGTKSISYQDTIYKYFSPITQSATVIKDGMIVDAWPFLFDLIQDYPDHWDVSPVFKEPEVNLVRSDGSPFTSFFDSPDGEWIYPPDIARSTNGMLTQKGLKIYFFANACYLDDFYIYLKKQANSDQNVYWERSSSESQWDDIISWFLPNVSQFEAFKIKIDTSHKGDDLGSRSQLVFEYV